MIANLGGLRRHLTPFNIIAGLILAGGLALTVMRFGFGLGAVTNLDDANPWGIWIGFDILCGVALAAGGFTIATTVHVFRVHRYEAIVRPAVLTGFLGYFLVTVGLLFDLGRPWRVVNPVFGEFGPSSVMFEVGWCVFLYLIVLFLEFSPAMLEWLGWKRVRGWALKLTMVLSIAGMVLSTLHQSSLGSLFLLTPGRLHPLWYSPYVPVFFFVSAIAAGLAMVIFEGWLTHRFFPHKIAHDAESHARFESLTLGLGKAAAVVLFAYFGVKLLGIAGDNHWALLASPWGMWFLVELIGFVALPCALFTWGYRNQSVRSVRIAAVLTVLGIVLNRLNVSVIAFGWKAADPYYPSWMEIGTSVAIVTAGVVVFRWIVQRMPILNTHPDYQQH